MSLKGRKRGSLYPATRICCVCKAEARNQMRTRPKGDPNIVSLTPLIYRRGNGKATLKNSLRIQVCEPCLVTALTAGRLHWAFEDNKLWDAIRESILNRYSAMLREDAA